MTAIDHAKSTSITRIACDECRRRKLRCDRLQPRCSVCQDSGIDCETTARGIRGPQKGYVQALKNRVMHLEAMLKSSFDSHHEVQSGTGQARTGDMPTISSVDVSETTAVDGPQNWLPSMTDSEPRGFLSSTGVPHSSNDLDWTLGSEPTLISSADVQLTKVMHAELDQLYLDRVHPSIPILHQRRYLSWSKSSTKSSSQTCLQYSMWTLATLLSAQFPDLTEPFYRKTKRMLESLTVESIEFNGCDTELVQSWVLVATCESMRTNHKQAWMSAGRVFRLVQGLRFNEIDRPRNAHVTSFTDSEELIEIESKRRVFWMAYLLDHLFSIRSDWPVTLNEHVICTRLPSSDAEFQRGHHSLGNFLSEAMTEQTPTVHSPFNECIILATICGRSLLRGQRHQISKAYGDTTAIDELEQQEGQWVNSLLSTRLEILSRFYPSPSETDDPLFLFANILAQTTLIYYCKGVIESVSHHNSMTVLLECQDRALSSSASITNLANILCELHLSKIHPLTPLPLFFVAEFLYDHRNDITPPNTDTDGGISSSYQSCLHDLSIVLGRLKNVNNNDQSYLDLLPRSCVEKSGALLRRIVGSDGME